MAYKIQNIPDKDIFLIEDEKVGFLIYAPLAGLTFLVSPEEVENIENASIGGVSTPECIKAWKMLQAKRPVIECSSPQVINEITFLLNQRCNFSCTYCYSAHGRSNIELGKEQIHKALDFFIKQERGKHLSIIFSGGGDPMLSFNRFQEAVNYSEILANKQNITLSIGIVTNGSTLKKHHIKFLKEHQINLVLSFEILKDVHNTQRSHFDTVVDTLFSMVDAGLPFGLRCTITPINVCRQCEMVETLHRDYPQIKSAAFETVFSRDLFETEELQTKFYNQFVHNYFQARTLGEQYGIDIGNTIFNSVDCCKIRACPGKLVVTPDGALTACSRISMPKESHYNLFTYGQIDSNGISIDNEKYNLLMRENVRRHPECNTCIAKWHCGGGCLLARQTLAERMPSYCRFMEQMIVETLKYHIR